MVGGMVAREKVEQAKCCMPPADAKLTVNAFNVAPFVRSFVIHLNVAKRTVLSKLFNGKLST